MIGGLDKQKNDIIAAMDSVNRLSATLVKEKDVIGTALDSMGPALKVLNEQHPALITMLRQLDKLGVVGTRVLNASTDNIVASLRHLQPVLTKLGDAGDALPNGLSMLASFPFPKEAADIARGDYANALFHLDFDLGNWSSSRRTRSCPTSSTCAARCRWRRPATALSPALKATRLRGRIPPTRRRAVPAGQPGVEAAPVPSPDLGLPGGSARRAPPGCVRWRRARRPPRPRGRWQRMTRGVKVRLMAFVVLSAVGIVYVAGSFLGITDRLLGRELNIKATLPTSGGLFTGSEVTYRGVKVGKVSAMRVTRTGLLATLTLKEGTKIPLDTKMYVHNLSAVGEQYLDFEPPDDKAPYATNGAVIKGDDDEPPDRATRCC